MPGWIRGLCIIVFILSAMCVAGVGKKPSPVKRTATADAQRITQAIRSHLPAGNKVMQVAHLAPRRGRGVWVVLSAIPVKHDSVPSGWPHFYSNLHLTVVNNSRSKIRILYQSERLAGDRFGYDEYHEIPLQLIPQRGSILPHIAVSHIFHGASWSPSHLSIFTWDGRQLRKLFGAYGDDPLWVKDLKHDGRFEIGATYAIGYDLAHVSQPRWTDIYAWNGRSYALVNERFPGEFRQLSEYVSTALREHPNDFQLLKYQGILDLIHGHRRTALKHFQLAETACSDTLRTEESPELRNQLQWELEDIRRRVTTLRTNR